MQNRFLKNIGLSSLSWKYATYKHKFTCDKNKIPRCKFAKKYLSKHLRRNSKDLLYLE